MFKFNTTTIINSNEDFTTGLTLFEGDNGVLSVKRGLNFKKKYVRAIYKRAYNEPELAKVEVDLTNIGGNTTIEAHRSGVFRIAIYIRLQGSENEYFANDYVFKGKPFYIEFVKKSKDETAAQLAQKVVKIAKKYMQMVYELPLVSVTANGAKVIFEATDEYQRFMKVDLQYYNEEIGLTTGCCTGAGDWETIASLTDENDNSIVFAQKDGKDLKGKEGFGTYRNLVKNLRLPTADNLRWGHILQDEVPVPGATYDQYTIWYCRKVGVQGLDAVGDIVQSLTSHIFFVNSCVSDAWEAAIAEIGTVTDVEDTSGVSVPVDTVEDLWEQNSQPEEEEQQGGGGGGQ